MFSRGVRGATTTDADTAEAILECTRDLLLRVIEANGIVPDDVAGAVFTVTPDLTAAFPARAARDIGWVNVPLMCAQEIAVPGALNRCVRLMLFWNTDKRQDEVVHIYLRGARALRPDLASAHEAMEESS